jgi:hypothetical protein
MTNVSAFFSEFFATAVLLGLILALGDANNNPAPAGMNGMILLWLIVGIGAALGTQTAYCLNPARDLGPRIAAACFGYGKDIWTYRNGYFAYVAIVAPICGAVFGGFFYDLFCFVSLAYAVSLRHTDIPITYRADPNHLSTDHGARRSNSKSRPKCLELWSSAISTKTYTHIACQRNA